MSKLKKILTDALHTALAEDHPEVITKLNDEFNIFEVVDSFSIVNILLESESALEASTGSYVSLADETIFDASKSPLLNWTTWIKYVEGKINV